MTKYTSIASQLDDGSTALTVFADIDTAKSWFYTANALQCSVDYCSRAEYALVADGNGQNTQLKRTEEFDNSGNGQLYNNRKIELIGAGDWRNDRGGKPIGPSTESTDHIF
jgi:hypothetical protein